MGGKRKNGELVGRPIILRMNCMKITNQRERRVDVTKTFVAKCLPSQTYTVLPYNTSNILSPFSAQ